MIRINHEIFMAFCAVVAVVAVYFFSYQLQTKFSRLVATIQKKLGTYALSHEHELQRYVYQHKNSVIAIVYRWINTQLIAIGLKKDGVTPLGYLIFWGFASLVLAVILGVVLGFNVFFTSTFWLVLWVCMLVMTRVVVSERIEKRESEVMDAIDLLVPEIHNGTKNAIITYSNSFPPGIRDDFKMFIVNIQDRGYTFNEAMYILADQLGNVFQDFAEKAIYYEAMGEKDLLDIFTDIVETNRLRRQLREKNDRRFMELKVTFLVSAFMTFVYFIFIISTDAFSRHFLLQTTAGNISLLIICIIIFGVMAFITTIKSRTI